MRLTINDGGIVSDHPPRTRFLIAWDEVDEITLEDSQDVDKDNEATYVTRLIKQGRGSSVPVSKPASAYFRIETSSGESVTFAIAGISPDQFRQETSNWVEWPDFQPAN